MRSGARAPDEILVQPVQRLQSGHMGDDGAVDLRRAEARRRREPPPITGHDTVGFERAAAGVSHSARHADEVVFEPEGVDDLRGRRQQRQDAHWSSTRRPRSRPVTPSRHRPHAARPRVAGAAEAVRTPRGPRPRQNDVPFQRSDDPRSGTHRSVPGNSPARYRLPKRRLVSLFPSQSHLAVFLAWFRWVVVGD